MELDNRSKEIFCFNRWTQDDYDDNYNDEKNAVLNSKQSAIKKFQEDIDFASFTWDINNRYIHE